MFENKFSEIINFVEGKIWLIQSFNKNGCFLRKKISSKNVKFYINQNPVESIKNHYHCSNLNYECHLGRFHTSVQHKDHIFSAPKIRQFNTLHSLTLPSVQDTSQFNTKNPSMGVFAHEFLTPKRKFLPTVLQQKFNFRFYGLFPF